MGMGGGAAGRIGGGEHTHRIDSERIGALEHPRNIRVQLQEFAVLDHAVAVTKRGAGLRAQGSAWASDRQVQADGGTYFHSTIVFCMAGSWLELYMADTFQPEPKRLIDLEKQSL